MPARNECETIYQCKFSNSECNALFNEKKQRCCINCCHEWPEGFPRTRKKEKLFLKKDSLGYTQSLAEEECEKILEHLKKSRGYDYRNQVEVVNEKNTLVYRLDFLVEKNGKKICIEIDGAHHKINYAKDLYRDRQLQNIGVPTFRFPASIFYFPRRNLKAFYEIQSCLVKNLGE